MGVALVELRFYGIAEMETSKHHFDGEFRVNDDKGDLDFSYRGGLIL